MNTEQQIQQACAAVQRHYASARDAAGKGMEAAAEAYREMAQAAASRIAFLVGCMEMDAAPDKRVGVMEFSATWPRH